MEKRKKSRKKEERQERKKRSFFIITQTKPILLTLLVLISFLFNGCMMAAIPLLMAGQAGLGAFAITKTVQRSTDGSVEIEIGENEILGQNKLTLTEISKLAVWPDEETEVFLADELQQSKTFVSVITPSKVDKIINKIGLDRKINNLTQKEMVESFQLICKYAKTDAVVAFKDLGHRTHSNVWSFSRSSTNFKGRMFIYALKSNQIIYSSIVSLKIYFGGSSQNQLEMKKKAARMLAKKIIILRQGSTKSTISKK